MTLKVGEEYSIKYGDGNYQAIIRRIFKVKDETFIEWGVEKTSFRNTNTLKRYVEMINAAVDFASAEELQEVTI